MTSDLGVLPVRKGGGSRLGTKYFVVVVVVVVYLLFAAAVVIVIFV